jgi:hypothetical protein
MLDMSTIPFDRHVDFSKNAGVSESSRILLKKFRVQGWAAFLIGRKAKWNTRETKAGNRFFIWPK